MIYGPNSCNRRGLIAFVIADNIPICWWRLLRMVVQHHPTSNICNLVFRRFQHVTSNICLKCWPKMFLRPTSFNIVFKRFQHVAPNMMDPTLPLHSSVCCWIFFALFCYNHGGIRYHHIAKHIFQVIFHNILRDSKLKLSLKFLQSLWNYKPSYCKTSAAFSEKSSYISIGKAICFI